MKFKRIVLIILTFALLLALAVSPLAVSAALADDGQNVAVDQVADDLPTESAGIEEISDGFVDYLKGRYGDDYQYYYDKIIENWGSVEAYLLSFGERLPDEHKTAWQYFVGWLSDYSSVWAPAFAVIALIIAAVIGKKQFEKIVKECVDKKVAPIISEMNKQSKGIAAISSGTKALLPKSEKFAESAEQLDSSAKELTDG